MSAKLTKQLSFALLDSGNVVVSAVADNVNAQIVVTVTGMGFYSGITIYRVVNSVRTSIRGAVNTPIGGVSSLVFFDYEAPLDVNVSYVAVLDDSLQVGSNTVNIVTDGRTFWLKDVILGAFSCKVKVEEMSDVTRPANVLGQFKILGRQNPILVTDVRQGRTGSMTLSAFSLSDRTALLDIISSGNTLLFQAPATANFPDMYFQAGDVVQTWRGISSTDIHSFVVPFTETDAPSGSAFSLANNSWLLVTQFADWQDVLVKRATWKDVLLTPFSDADSSVVVVPDIVDAFGRTVSNDWGTADSGDVWLQNGSPSSSFNVTPGTGTILLPSVGTQLKNLITPSNNAFVNSTQYLSFQSSISSVTGTGAIRMGELLCRYIDSNNYYSLLARVNTDQSITMYILKNFGGSTTNLVSGGATGLTWTANSTYTIKASANGNTLSCGVWSGGIGNDPGGYLFTVNDSSLSAVGQLGMQCSTNTGNTNTPFTISFTNYQASALV